jgi:hypothetical protein
MTKVFFSCPTSIMTTLLYQALRTTTVSAVGGTDQLNGKLTLEVSWTKLTQLSWGVVEELDRCQSLGFVQRLWSSSWCRR